MSMCMSMYLYICLICIYIAYLYKKYILYNIYLFICPGSLFINCASIQYLHGLDYSITKRNTLLDG